MDVDEKEEISTNGNELGKMAKPIVSNKTKSQVLSNQSFNAQIINGTSQNDTIMSNFKQRYVMDSRNNKFSVLDMDKLKSDARNFDNNYRFAKISGSHKKDKEEEKKEKVQSQTFNDSTNNGYNNEWLEIDFPESDVTPQELKQLQLKHKRMVKKYKDMRNEAKKNWSPKHFAYIKNPLILKYGRDLYSEVIVNPTIVKGYEIMKTLHSNNSSNDKKNKT